MHIKLLNLIHKNLEYIFQSVFSVLKLFQKHVDDNIYHHFLNKYLLFLII